MSAKINKPKRNHHELPELYLRGFCENSLLWIYKRERPYYPGIRKPKYNPFRCGVVEIAEKDRYASVRSDGTRDFESYENKLEKIEKPADNILRKIYSQMPIISNEKEVFAKYIQNLLKRTKERDKRIRPILDKNQKIQSRQLNNYASLCALNGQFKTAKEYYDVEKHLESDDVKKNIYLESMITLYPKLHETIKSMSWKFYVAANDSYFVTSNAPVTFDPVGLSISPLLFPVSKKIALIATHNHNDKETDLEFKNASSDETLIINFYTIINATSVYAPKQESWIWEILEHGLAMTENQSFVFGKLFPFRASG